MEQPVKVSPHASALLATLSSHLGAGKGIPAKALAQFINWPERKVRTFVTELRMAGVAVCGHPRTGYFIAESDAELEHTCKFLRARAVESLKLESRLRKVPMQDLLGQLRLGT